MSYNSIVKQAEFRLLIKKSEFIGRASPVDTEQEAEKFINTIKNLEYKATHNCYCYILNEEASVMRFSDDGEPQGTAGLPMLELCKQKELQKLVLVVTRYFGGIKLGASGLIRAYRSASEGALEKAEIVKFVKHVELSIDFTYTYIGRIDYYKGENRIFERRRFFTDRVKIVWLIEERRLSNVKRDLLNICNGEINMIETGSDFYPEDLSNREFI